MSKAKPQKTITGRNKPGRPSNYDLHKNDIKKAVLELDDVELYTYTGTGRGNKQSVNGSKIKADIIDKRRIKWGINGKTLGRTTAGEWLARARKEMDANPGQTLMDYFAHITADDMREPFTYDADAVETHGHNFHIVAEEKGLVSDPAQLSRMTGIAPALIVKRQNQLIRDDWKVWDAAWQPSGVVCPTCELCDKEADLLGPAPRCAEHRNIKTSKETKTRVADDAKAAKVREKAVKAANTLPWDGQSTGRKSATSGSNSQQS